MHFIIVKHPILPTDLEAEFSDPSCGAFVSFCGRVRNHHDGRTVTGLEYEAYSPMALGIFSEIGAEVKRRFGVNRLAIVHRVGKLVIGDIAVWIGAEAAHRDAAFEAARYAIDQVKERAPIWKKEFYPDAEPRWVACHHGSRPA